MSALLEAGIGPAELLSIAELAVAASVCGLLCLFDLHRRILPNELVLVLAGCGVGFHAATGWRFLSPWSSLGGLILAVVGLMILRTAYRAWRGVSGLGLGDVKLAAAAGVWIGWIGVPWLIAIASGLSLVVLPSRVGLPGALRASIPFGPALCAALALLVGFRLAVAFRVFG